MHAIDVALSSEYSELRAERDEALHLREADLEFAWESGAATALRAEGYEVVAHAAVFEQNPYKPKS